MSQDWSSRPQRVVVAAFLHDRGEVLLARRPATKRIAPGKFHLPGGHVEHGEHPSDALARELREELAAEVTIEEPIFVFSYLWESDHTVGIVYAAELRTDRDLLKWDVTDIETCAWVKEHQLAEHLTPADHNLQAAKTGFAWLARRQT